MNKSTIFLILIFFLFSIYLVLQSCKHWRCTKVKINAYLTYQLFHEKINLIEDCKISEIKKIPNNSILVIGHLYGAKQNDFIKKEQYLDSRVIKLINENQKKFDLIIFNGDIFFNPSKRKWKYIKNFMEEKNLQFMIAPGNHDITNEIVKIEHKKTQQKTFDNVFNFNYPSILLKKKNEIIVRDTINMDWSPTENEITFINKGSESNHIFIIQHHTALKDFRFYTNDKLFYKRHNNKNILNLKEFLKFIKPEKNLTFIIGDFGAYDYQNRIECKTFKNLNYIVNGLGGKIDDKVIIINANKSFLYKLN